MTMTGDQAATGAAPRVEFRATAGLGAWLASRRDRTVLGRAGDSAGSPLGMQARMELALWREALAAELAAMPPIPLAWAEALAEVTGGEQMSGALSAVAGDGTFRPVLWAEWAVARQDALASGHPGNTFAARHGLDEAALDSWLRSLTPVRDHAIRDALSRWWADVCPMDGARGGEGDEEFRASSPAGFGIAGLRVADGANG